MKKWSNPWKRPAVSCYLQPNPYYPLSTSPSPDPHTSLRWLTWMRLRGVVWQAKSSDPLAHKATTDTERHATTLQGIILPPYIGAHHPLQYPSRKHFDQQCCT